MTWKAVFVGAALLAAGPALAQTTGTNKTPEGKAYMQTGDGHALYVYDKDRTTGGTPGAPTCNDQCAKVWPPFLAGANAKPTGDWGLAKRKDGAEQWTYKKRPLYTFVRDTKPGNIEGDGFGGNTWHLAEP